MKMIGRLAIDIVDLPEGIEAEAEAYPHVKEEVEAGHPWEKAEIDPHAEEVEVDLLVEETVDLLVEEADPPVEVDPLAEVEKSMMIFF